MVKGEITVFLTLVFILLLSFISAMVESASIQLSKNYRRTVMDKAINSVFAEYQKDMLEEYNVFTLEGSYETGEYAREEVVKRLSFYGATQGEQEMTKLQLLTDNNGAAFKEQVVFYMQNKLGIDIMKDVLDTTSKWQEMEIQGKEFSKTEEDTKTKLDTQLSEEGIQLAQENNPIETISVAKQSNLLKILMPKEVQISEKTIVLEEQPSQRELEKGQGSVQVSQDAQGPMASVLLGEYLLEHFAMANKPNEMGALSYELEYLLEGKSSDQENLKGVVEKLLLMRVGPNFLYLQGDTEKVAEARALGVALASATALPILTEVVTQAILAAWAFGESIIDIRSLLNQKKVPVIKTYESWQLQLTSLLKLGTEEEELAGKDSATGLEYKDYIRMLLFLEKENSVVMRSLDIIENKMKVEKELSFFNVDHCINKMELQSTCSLRRGITYSFSTYFGYQ